MSFSRQIQLTIGTITVLAITLLGGYTYHTTTLDIQTQHLRESDAIYNFLMAVRRVGQRQFIESGIPLTDKTVGFLPAHSLPAVSKEFTKNWDTRGIEIRTSSDRPRNPNNRANPNEQIALNWFRNNDEEEIFTTIIRDNFFYARPLWIVNSCLKCHGEQASAPPTIRDSYSSAYDYKVGELRGIVSITTPIEGIDRKILAAFLPKALFLLISGLLSALLINHFLQRFLNQREVAEAELQQTQKQLEKENQHTQAIMASMNEGVVVINPEGTIQQVNPKLEQLTGRTEAALLHQPIDSLFVEAELFQTQLLSMQGGHDGKGKTGRLSSDLSLLNQSGEVTPVHLSGSLLQQTGHSFEGTVLIVHDISTRLRDSEERFRAITQSTNEGIISIDSQGGVIFWNRGAERIFGYAFDEIRGMGLTTIIPERYRAAHNHAIQRIVARGEERITGSAVDMEGLHKEGHEIPISLSLSRWSKNGEIHFSGVISDISKRRAEELALQQAKEGAEKANLAKDEFLASMSHELRTPLSSIIGNSELLAEMKLGSDAQTLIQSIGAAGQGQLALVNDILDMSKIESGKFTIEENPYNLSLLLQDIEQMFSARAQDSGLELIVRQTNPESHQLIGDGQRIGQILINLVGNAIKFTENGTVSLSSRTEGGYLIFQVRDSGEGMSPETIDQLFQRFEQADGSISRRFGGSGLGLFISESLAELMGGFIDASSQEGMGSIFELILPYLPSSLPERGAEAKPSSSVLNEKLVGQVLIAEDTPELQLLERRILQSMGLSVAVANNGKEAVDLASSEPFDLILMDMQMPVMDGIEATRRLRRAGSRIPIVALTANVMQSHRDQFTEAGCNDFLSKPIDRQILRQTIRPYLKLESES